MFSIPRGNARSPVGSAGADATTAEAAVELDAVAVWRGGRQVLRDVSLTVVFAEIVVVRGANGAGKSSLLRVMAGIAPAHAGDVLRVTSACAFVPERIVLAPAMRPSAWLDAMDRVRSTRRPWPDLAADWRLDEGALAGPVARLSKGQLQRVVLLEALTAPLDLVVLDEPWAGLDADGRELLAGTLRRRAATGAAVVISDHSGAGTRLLDPGRRLLVAGGRVGPDEAGANEGRVRIVARDPVSGAIEQHEVSQGEHDHLIGRLLDDGLSIEGVQPL